MNTAILHCKYPSFLSYNVQRLMNTATISSRYCIIFTISSSSIALSLLFLVYSVIPYVSYARIYTHKFLGHFYTLDENCFSTLRESSTFIYKRPIQIDTATFPRCSCIFFTISSLRIVLSLLFLHYSFIPYVPIASRIHLTLSSLYLVTIILLMKTAILPCKYPSF